MDTHVVERTLDIKEEIWQTMHFEAIPAGETYTVVHRGTRSAATRGQFGPEIISVVLNAMESAYYHGMNRALQRCIKQTEVLTHELQSEVFGAQSNEAQKILRPI